MTIGWVTNDPVAAKSLRKADKAYQKACEAARSLSLAEKIVALNVARETRRQAYQEVAQ